MKRYAISMLAGVAAGLLALAWAHREPLRPPLHDKVWQITDPGGKPVHPHQPLRLPNPRYGDFDLTCRVELPANADLDLLFRKVEAWDEEVPRFHGRFAAVRMSSRKDGPGFLTREQLLFGPEEGGIRFSPGIPASVELACRGRRATALVNGIELGPFETVDDFGNLAFVCRQGTAVVHDLRITPWPVRRSRGVWWVGAAVGGLLGLLLALMHTPWLRVTMAMVVTVAGGGLGGAMLDALCLPLVRPTDLAWGLSASCLVVAAASLGGQRARVLPRVVLLLVVGGGGAAALLESAAQEMRWGLRAGEDPRLTLFFGPESGLGPFRAVARLLKNEYAVHTLDPTKRTDVLLLGPARMFDAPGDPTQNVSAMLPSLLRQRLKIPAQSPAPRCVALASPLSSAQQLVWGLDRYFRDYRPKVVVLGLTSDEDDCHLLYGGSPRQRYAAYRAAEPAGGAPSWILPHWWFAAGAAEGAATAQFSAQSPAELRATLDQLRSVCGELDARLVLVVDDGLSPGFKRLAKAFAKEAENTPIVEGFAADAGVLGQDALADVVVRALIR